MVPAAISSTPCLFISAVYPPGSSPGRPYLYSVRYSTFSSRGERRSCGTPPFSGTAWSCQAWHGLTRRQLVARAGQSLQFVAADAGWHIAGFESFLAAAAIVAIRPHELDADVRRHLPPTVTTRVRPACSVTDCGSSGLSMGLPEPTEVALPLSSNVGHQLSSFREYLPAIGENRLCRVRCEHPSGSCPWWAWPMMHRRPRRRCRPAP